MVRGRGVGPSPLMRSPRGGAPDFSAIQSAHSILTPIVASISGPLTVPEPLTRRQ